MTRKEAVLLLPPAIVLAVLLLAGGPHHSSRLWQAVWDLGHLPAFALWTFLLLRLPALRKRSFLLRFGAALLFALVAGIATEGAQQAFGRSFDWHDVGRNLAGSALAVSLLAPGAGRGRLLLAARLGAGAALLAAVYPASVITADELAGRSQFPLLAGFESPLEVGRWGGSAGRSRAAEVAFAGRFSLRTEFGTERYSGIFLKHFPRDWRGYRTLQIAVFNPANQPVRLNIFLADRAHDENGWLYADRFNAVRLVPPGWSALVVDLEEAAAAPTKRAMELGEIDCLGFFTARLPAPAILYFDEVRLLPASSATATFPAGGGR